MHEIHFPHRMPKGTVVIWTTGAGNQLTGTVVGHDDARRRHLVLVADPARVQAPRAFPTI
jgi:hypothetical protein